jgi:hypothetical protein
MHPCSHVMHTVVMHPMTACARILKTSLEKASAHATACAKTLKRHTAAAAACPGMNAMTPIHSQTTHVHAHRWHQHSIAFCMMLCIVQRNPAACPVDTQVNSSSSSSTQHTARSNTPHASKEETNTCKNYCSDPHTRQHAQSTSVHQHAVPI